MSKNSKFVCPNPKNPRRISIGQCFGCPFVAASLEEAEQIVSITCGFSGQEGRRIDRPQVNKINRDGLI